MTLTRKHAVLAIGSLFAILVASKAACTSPAPTSTIDAGGVSSQTTSPRPPTPRPRGPGVHFGSGPSEPASPAACVKDHAILNTIQVSTSFLKSNPDFAKTIGCDAIVALCSTPGCPGMAWTCKTCDGTDFSPPVPTKPDAP